MAITQVQKKERTPLNTSSFSPSITFASTPVAGNLLLTAVGSATAAGITFTAPAGWTMLYVAGANDGVNVGNGGTPNGRPVAIAYKISAGTESAVTWTTTANTTIDMILVEYSGVSALDVSVTNFKPNNGGGATVPELSFDCGTTGTTTVNDELAIAVCVTANRSGETFSNGFTRENSDTSRCMLGSKVLSATGAVQTTASWTITGNSSVGGIFTFKAAGGPATTPQTLSCGHTQTPSRTLSVGKQVAATQTQTPSSVRLIATTLAVVATQVPTAAKQIAKTLATAMTQVPTSTRSIAKKLAVTNAQTASLTAQAAKVMTFAVTQTQTAAVVKQVAKRLTVTQTQTPTNQRSVGKVITATETQTPTARRQVGKTIAVTHTQTPAMQRTIGKILGAVQHAAATLISTTVGLSIAIGDHFYMALETNKVSGVEAGGVHVVNEAQVFYHTDPDEQEETT